MLCCLAEMKWINTMETFYIIGFVTGSGHPAFEILSSCVGTEEYSASS